jgi:hypothetical protein
MANLNASGNSILTMPLPDTKAAPEKFRGRYTRIKSFLIHYELLLDQNNVLSDKDKCELVTRYCSRKVTEFIQALPSYTDKKWANLKDDLLKYYDADLDNKKYRVKDLVNLVKACKDKKLKNLAAWREYGRRFITVGGWLRKRGKISGDEYATYYWNGIPRTLRGKLENRMLAKDPVRSLANPFTVDEINSAAEALLQRDRFDMNFAGSDDEDASGGEYGESEDTSDSDSEDELRAMRRRVRKRARYAKRRGSVSESDDSMNERVHTSKHATRELRRKVNSKDEPEVETLIRQLNTMSLDDPGYAALVFRALKLDPDVLKVIRPPVFVTRPNVPNVPQFPRATQPYPTFQPQVPPHMTQGFPAPRAFGRSGPTDEDRDRCFGCGVKGHMMGRCPEMQDLMARNVVVRNETGRYVYGDGRPIRRIPGETIVDAVRHELNERVKNEGATSHLIRVVEPESEGQLTNEAYYGNLDSDTEESEEEGGDDKAVSAAVIEWGEEHDEKGFTYPVTRSGRVVSAKRREAMEGEYQQSRKQKNVRAKGDKGDDPKENTRTATSLEPQANPVPATTRMQFPVPIGNKRGGVVKRNEEGEKQGGPVPVETRRPEYNGKSDESIMQDVIDQPMIDRAAQPRKHEVPEKERSKNNSVPEQNGERRVAGVRQSEVSSQVKPLGVLNQVLNTRIELAIGEVLGISKDLSALLGDKIKPKTTKPSAPIVTSLQVATSFYTKNRGLLIQLHMQCDGRPITAIIDTGSQLNIVSKNICDSKIMRPVDNKEKISIADANGGQGKLEGIVKNVPLHCGEVATCANLYVGTHVPFELLLGRPWQRGNYVSIDERRSGTYLLFKDPVTLESRYEIQVSVDRSQPDSQYELPVWNVPESPLSYLVTVDQSPEDSELAVNGPTTRPRASNSIQLPFSDSTEDLIVHSPGLQHSFQSPSILLTQGTSIANMNHLTPESDDASGSISSTSELRRILPELDFLPPDSMTLGLRYQKTEAQVGSAVPPLASKTLLRFDSEVVNTALADIPFLKRTNNLHPLILSTADGVLLGHATDPVGHSHTDYIFLNAGIFNLSSTPFSVTPASAFVRLFPDLSGGPPQPWLLPYISDPPASVMVSLLPKDYERLSSNSNNFEFVLKQFKKGNQPVTLPTAPPTSRQASLTPIVEESVAATGAIDPDISKHLDSHSETLSVPILPGTKARITSAAPTATVSDNDNTDYFSFTNSQPTISTSDTRPRRPSLPSPDSSYDGCSEGFSASDSSQSLSTSGGETNEDAEMDLEDEAKMEWEELKSEIRKEVECEFMKEVGDVIRKEVEEEFNKEAGNVILATEADLYKDDPVSPKLDRDIYDRLYASYCQVTGEAPTERTMVELQNTYIMLLERNIVPFVPRNSPLQPAAADSTSVNGVNDGSPMRILPPRPTAALGKYTPIKSSPLVNSPNSTKQTEPTTVFMVKGVTNCEDDSASESSESSSDMPPLVLTDSMVLDDPLLPVSPPIKIELATPPPTDDEMGPKQVPIGETSPDDASESLLVPTVPSSPVGEQPLDRDNRFLRPRKVGKLALIENLRTELSIARQDLEIAKASGREVPQGYHDRLAETIDKLKEMESDQVGELDTHQLYLAGLMNIIRLTEAISVPLPCVNPPMVPRSSLPPTTEGALADVMSDADPTKVVQYCPIRDEYGPSPSEQSKSSKIPQCPSQPPTNVDPRTIPIATRPYFEGGTNDFIKRAGGAKKPVIVDIRSFSIISDAKHVPAPFIRQFTELRSPLDPFIFPGTIAPVHDWPLDTPKSRANNYQERVEELREARRAVETIHQSTVCSLTRAELAECLHPQIMLHKRISSESTQLCPINIDRIYFWSRLHPTWNPLLKPVEAAFLRGAIYAYYRRGNVKKAEELERLLRTPHFDDWEIRELVSLGALDNEFREGEALDYFRTLEDEHWDFHATEDAFREAANDILESMDETEDGEIREPAGRPGHAFKPCREQADSEGAQSVSDCAGFPVTA